MRVNLWDRAFAHVAYSVPERVSENIEWVRDPKQWDTNAPTIVTDECLPLVRGIRPGGKMIGWLLEGRAYGARNYAVIPSVIDHLDLLFTHDDYLLRTYTEKARFVPFGGCWIPDETWGLHEKSKRISHIYSAKSFMEGHKLRHEVGRKCHSVDHFGYGTERPLARKEDGLSAYQFSIVIENDRATNYFTEKLLDCFALGTIPIYWGCPNIGEFFDMAGIIPFSGIEELPDILSGLSYEQHIEAAGRNLESAKQYALPENWMYEHHLKHL